MASSPDATTTSAAKSTEDNPTIPMIPDDIDDGNDNYPQIMSVFSLASSSSDESPTKNQPSKDTENNDDAQMARKPPKEVAIKCAPSNSPPANPANPANLNTTNAPFFLGKGKFNKIHLSTNSEEGMVSSPPQPVGVTFSKMVSIQPITAAKTDVNSTITGQTLPAKKIINLGASVPFLSQHSAKTQIAVPPLNCNVSPGGSAPGSTVFQIKRIAPATTTTKPISVVKSPPTTIATSQPVVLPVAQPMQQKPRHVNIAPAPPVLLLNQTSPTKGANAIGTTNAPTKTTRVVVPTVKQGIKPAGSSGQLMYLIENKTADGKVYRFLIPTDSAKIVPTSNAKTVTVASTKGQAGATTAVPIASTITSPSQLIKIIPKPSQVPAALETTTVSAVTSSIPSTAVKANPPANQPAANPTTGAKSTTSVAPVNRPTAAAPPVATSLSVGSNNKNEAVESESWTSPTASPPLTPSTPEEPPHEEDALDLGLSPHEARIQKLKDLLKKQEDAVNRLREKRKKEIDDVHATPPTTQSSDSTFAVPRPPKKPRIDRKPQDTQLKGSKDGFLPNTDDTHFVKLIGLEQVVDKIKAKKGIENKDS